MRAADGQLVASSVSAKHAVNRQRLTQCWTTHSIQYPIPTDRRGTVCSSSLPRGTVCSSSGHRWLDKYHKDECVKCLTPLSRNILARNRRNPGEASTLKEKPSSAMESSSGVCREGGAHEWRFGRCRKCGKPQGTALEQGALRTREYMEGDTYETGKAIRDSWLHLPPGPPAA